MSTGEVQMAQRHRLTRRRFLATAALSIMAARLPWASDEPAAQPEAMPAWLRGAVPDPGPAARFGKAYLLAHPAENDAVKLAETLGRSLDSDPTDGPATGLERLDDVVRADFAKGQVVLVDGWLLSRTEARFYALVTLTSS